jgi:hypothetical protein
MTDGEPIVVSIAEQVQPLIEEVRLARMQAEEAVQRIQHRIERLVSLSEALDQPQGSDKRQELVDRCQQKIPSTSDAGDHPYGGVRPSFA